MAIAERPHLARELQRPTAQHQLQHDSVLSARSTQELVRADPVEEGLGSAIRREPVGEPLTDQVLTQQRFPLDGHHRIHRVPRILRFDRPPVRLDAEVGHHGVDPALFREGRVGMENGEAREPCLALDGLGGDGGDDGRVESAGEEGGEGASGSAIPHSVTEELLGASYVLRAIPSTPVRERKTAGLAGGGPGNGVR